MNPTISKIPPCHLNINQSSWAPGTMQTNQLNCTSKIWVLVVYKTSCHSLLEFATKDSIYQKLSGHHGPSFHEIYTVLICYFLLTNQTVVQCLQLPTFPELEASWTIKLVQEDPAHNFIPCKNSHFIIRNLGVSDKRRKTKCAEELSEYHFLKPSVWYMSPPKLLLYASWGNCNQVGVCQRDIRYCRRSGTWTDIFKVIWIHIFLFTRTKLAREGWKSWECKAIFQELRLVLKTHKKPANNYNGF